MRARSLTGPVFGLQAVRALLVTAVFAVLLVSLLRVKDDDSRTHGATEAVIAGETAERQTLELENAVRGYLLTRDRTQLASYRTAVRSLPGALRSVRASAATPGERRELDTIGAGIASWERNVAGRLLAGSARVRPQSQVALTDTGDRDQTVLETEFSRLVAQESAARTRQRSAANAAVLRAVVVAVAGLVLALLLELGLGLFLLRGVLRPIRRVALAAGRIAQGDLGARVPRTGVGEIAMLADAFNGMAASTEARTRELAGTQERLARAATVAEEASAMKSSFVANMSHEIRTPLNGLMGMLALLSETPLDEEQRKFVEIAVTSSDALMEVVGDVLDIAKIEAGRLEIEALDFDLHDTVESVCELMAGTARTKRLELQAFVHDDVPRCVRGDRVRVAQILQNLISNAIKFTAHGEVAVEVSLTELRDGGPLVRFDVTDTGIGIDAGQLVRLFEPFIQAEAGTTRKYGGTGLGLAISRELTELMGGSISAESGRGGGSTFSLELPFSRALSVPPEPLPEAALAGMRVLVVDDNATNRRVFHSYVASWGMRPTTASSLEEGRASLHEAARSGDPFRLALLDRHLGEEDGLELAAEIAGAPELAGVRAILLTSSSGGGARLPPSIRRRLTKPVRARDLLDAITRVMTADRRSGDRRTGERRSADRPAPPTGSAVPGARGAEDSWRWAGAHVLVGEDHDVNWMLIERLLLGRGLTPERAADGDAVIHKVSNDAFDLILMDCQMPVRDGYETAAEIRRREATQAQGSHVPIVAMTASVTEEARRHCREAGMDDFLAKPLETAELDAVLERWLAPVPEALEPERLAELARLFPDGDLPGVLAEMRAETETDIAELTQAVAARDAAAAAAAAHRIRNTAQIIGSAALLKAAARLDRPPREGEPAEAIDRRELDAVRQCWAAARAGLEVFALGSQADTESARARLVR